MLTFHLYEGEPREWRWLNAWGRLIGRQYKPRQLVSLAVLSPLQMQKMNKRWRKKNKPTDVLSFRYAEADQDRVLGELLICRAVAVKQAKEHGHSLIEELQVLTIHGTLHLLGFDHEKEKEAVAMEDLEKKLLVKLRKLAQK